MEGEDEFFGPCPMCCALSVVHCCFLIHFASRKCLEYHSFTPDAQFLAHSDPISPDCHG